MGVAAVALCLLAAVASASAEPTATNATCAAHRAAPGEEGAIPRKLHFIWWPGKAYLPAHLKTSLATWQKHHPSWETFIWGEKEVRGLVSTELNFIATHFKRVSTIGQNDLARYAILYHLGGLAIDLDVQCLRPFDAPLTGHDLLLFEPREDQRARTGGPATVLLASIPGHPLLRRMLDASLDERLTMVGGGRLTAILDRCEAAEANATQEATAQAMCSPTDGSCTVDGAPKPECGCRAAYAADPFFLPTEPALSTDGHAGPEQHVEAMRAFAQRVSEGAFPPADAYSVQYTVETWLASANSAAAALIAGVLRAQNATGAAAAANETVDGTDDGAAPREENPVDRAMQVLEPLVWYWWGERYKYPPIPAPAPGSKSAPSAPKPQLKRAQRAYARALELLPTFAAARFELGNVFREKRRLMLALDEYAKAQMLDPTNYMYSNNLGLMQLNVGRPADAEVNFKAALGLYERGGAPAVDINAKAGAMENLARALEAQGKVEEALPLYRQVARSGTGAQQSSVAPRILALEGKDKRMPVDVGQEALKRFTEKQKPLTAEELQEVKREGAVKFAQKLFGGRRA